MSEQKSVISLGNLAAVHLNINQFWSFSCFVGWLLIAHLKIVQEWGAVPGVGQFVHMASIQTNQNSDNQSSWKQVLDVMGCSNVNSYKWCSLFIGSTENTAFQFAFNVPLPWRCNWKLDIICLKDLEQEVFLEGETASVQGVAAIAWSHWGGREQGIRVAAFIWLHLASHGVTAVWEYHKVCFYETSETGRSIRGGKESFLFLIVLRIYVL